MTTNSPKRVEVFTLFLLLALLLRVMTLGMPALIDTTEGRYAAISQEMALSGDWVTPKIQLQDDLVPYMGKPPLYFWVSALSLQVFGMNEFGARFASFLAALISCIAVWRLSKLLYEPIAGRLSILILLSSAFFFFLSGAAVVDLVLTASVAVGMLSSGMVLLSDRPSKGYGLLFFAALGCGFLTKGPVAIVLMCAPIFFCLLITRSWRKLSRVPWITGTLVFLAISVPWFVASARINDDFLKYFFWNENVLRFLTKNYQDRYGSGHVYPYGTVWIAMIVALIPWVFLLPSIFWKRKINFRDPATQNRYLLPLLYGLTPALFFTFARQFSPLYVVPALPGIALFLGGYLTDIKNDPRWIQKHLARGYFVIIAAILVLIITGSVLESPITFLSAAIAIGMLLILQAGYVHHHKWELTKWIALFSLATVALYSVIILTLGSHFSRERSTGPVLELIAKDAAAPTTVGVVFGKFGNPFSPWFYDDSSTSQSKRFVIHAFDPEKKVNEPKPRYLIVQTKHLKNFIDRLSADGYDRGGTEGRWTAFKLKN